MKRWIRSSSNIYGMGVLGKPTIKTFNSMKSTYTKQAFKRVFESAQKSGDISVAEGALNAVIADLCADLKATDSDVPRRDIVEHHQGFLNIAHDYSISNQCTNLSKLESMLEEANNAL